MQEPRLDKLYIVHHERFATSQQRSAKRWITRVYTCASGHPRYEECRKGFGLIVFPAATAAAAAAVALPFAKLIIVRVVPGNALHFETILHSDRAFLFDTLRCRA
jgi:hypothetical protein